MARDKPGNTALGLVVVVLVFGYFMWPSGSKAPQQRAAEVAAKEWYEGGTLHASKHTDWLISSYRNQLATASDWVVIILGEDQVRDMPRLKYRANLLVFCIDKLIPAISKGYSPDTTDTRATAFLCITTFRHNNWRP